jgi:hypothetical protein
MQFFLSVITNGIGGQDGWGNLGPVVHECLLNVCRELDNTVGRMMRFRRMVEEDKKNRAIKAEAKRKADEAEAQAEREKAKKEKEDKRKLKKLQASKRALASVDASATQAAAGDGNSSDSSTGSASKKKKDRKGSTAGKSRRASVSNRKASTK